MTARERVAFKALKAELAALKSAPVKAAAKSKATKVKSAPKGGDCPNCGKHFRFAASIAKYHGWCKARAVKAAA